MYKLPKNTNFSSFCLFKIDSDASRLALASFQFDTPVTRIKTMGRIALSMILFIIVGIAAGLAPYAVDGIGLMVAEESTTTFAVRCIVGGCAGVALSIWWTRNY